MAGATCADHHDALGRKKTPQQNPRGINAAVRDLGIDRSEAQRAVKIDALTDAAKEAARAAGLDDNQSALLEAAKAQAADQAAETARTEGCPYCGYPLRGQRAMLPDPLLSR